MKGVAIMLGGDKSATKEASSEEALAKEAFSALQDSDEAGFVSAFLGAVKACVSKAKSSGYEDDKDDEE